MLDAPRAAKPTLIVFPAIAARQRAQRAPRWSFLRRFVFDIGNRGAEAARWLPK